ncbi:hypothetical protein H0H81_008069 [Sphagnurus paluster]|uniref:GPI inositol-deacylase n=1 Tax=Sphagnurus paluster TaxID=117069 RepID=A0A9P7GJ54_9AGAR|nr:hypothetical protein H0H81_008069 [Sphagnurus paluster]
MLQEDDSRRQASFADRLDSLLVDMPRIGSKPPPVLRWLTGFSTTSTPSNTPPSPSLADLNEALHEPLPAPPPLARPPAARLPDSFHASRSLSHAPPFLDNLTRSTLPTASLSAPLRSRSPSPAPLLLSTSTISSLDSLRSLSSRDHARSLSTSSAVAAPSPTVPARWWFQPEPLLTPEDSAENIHAKYRSPKNPIVFCHGLLGFDSVTIGPGIAPLEVTYWRGIKEVLEANGTEVLITRVPATSSPVDRAKVLEQKISEVYPGRSVHLIGHSMGGLDCRYMTTHLTDRKFKVLSITTIATPHRGSSFADHFLTTVGPTRMPSILSLLDLLPNGGGDGKAFECLTLESMRKFNEDTPDVEGVRYFSWGAMYEPGLIDTWKKVPTTASSLSSLPNGYTHFLMLCYLPPLTPITQGTYLGTLSHVNHLDLVGWINTARYKWAEIMGKEIKFHPATFYLGIADMLAGEVDGVPKQDEQSTADSSMDDVQQALHHAVSEDKASKSSQKAESPALREEDLHTPRGGEELVEQTAAGSGVHLQESEQTTPR